MNLVTIDLLRENYVYGAAKRFYIYVCEYEISRYSKAGENKAIRDAEMIREAFSAAGFAASIKMRVKD